MYKDIKFNKKKIVVSLIEIIIFVLVGVNIGGLTQKVYAVPIPNTYDFSSGSGVNKWFYYGKDHANDVPVAVDRSTWAEPGTEPYSYIEPYSYTKNESGLQGFWRFEEGAGESAGDSSGNSNTGTLYPSGAGPSWTTGKIGGALSFAGNDYIDCGNDESLNITDAITIEAWVKWNDKIYSYVLNMLTDKTDGTTSKVNLAVAGTGNGVGADVGEVYMYPGSEPVTLTNVILTENEWTHLVFSRTGTGTNQAHIYKDGVLSWTGTWTLTANNPYVLIGVMKPPSSNSFNGTIDEVKIYNRALSPEEVKERYGRLQGFWKFDEGTGESAEDSSTNSNTGTLYPSGTGPNWTIGVSGSALSFDGEDDYVDCGNDSSLDLGASGGSGTIEAWFKTTKTTRETLVSRVNPASPWEGYVFAISQNIGSQKLAFWSSSGSGTWVDANTIVTDGNWHHGVVTFSGTTCTFYLDGNFDGTKTIAPVGAYPSTTFQIGLTNGSTDYFDGLIDEVRIYNRALSAEEIKEHFYGSGPQAFWKFDEGGGTIAYDGSGRNNGTFGGDPQWVDGVHGKALDFDGVDDEYVVSAETIEVPAEGTISAWIKGDTADQISENIYPFGLYQMCVLGPGGGSSDNRAGLIARKDSTNYYYNWGGQGLYDGEWHHYAIAWDDTYVYLFIDGGQIGSPKAHSGNLPIGESRKIVAGTAWSIGAYGAHTGSIDEVKIYNRVLSAEEVRERYDYGWLQGFWKFDEGAGESAEDSSLNSNTGTLYPSGTGPTWQAEGAPASAGSALLFDGEDDYVNCGNDSSLNITDAITIEEWIKPVGLHDNIYGGIWWDSSSARNRTLIHDNHYALGQYFINGVLKTVLTPLDSIPLNIWTHITLTYNGSEIVFWINGKKQTPVSATGKITDTGTNLRKIGQGESTKYFFNGLIDDVKIYNRALSAEEIEEHYYHGYFGIKSEDDDVYKNITDTTKVFKEVVHDFVITINENPADIGSIELYWKGYAERNEEDTADNDLRMYLYNVNTPGWELVASSLDNGCPGPSDCTVTTTITADFSHYIDGNGHLRYLVQKFEQGDACDATCHTAAPDNPDYPPGCAYVDAGTDPENQCEPSWDSCINKCVREGYDGDCDGAGACNKSATSNISSGYVCTGSGEQTTVSSSNYCNYDEDCDDGDCSATEWWTSCNGSGSCRVATDYKDAYSENVYAGESYTLTSSCGTTGTTICEYSAFYKCDGACQKGRDKYRCSSAHTCSYDVGDSWSYLSTAGRVCSGGGEVDPSSDLYCDITIQCAERDCSAEKWYRGCAAGGSSCIGNLTSPYGMQPAGTWDTSSGYVVNTTEYKVGTSCSQTQSKACSLTCKTCNGSGLCNTYKTNNWGSNAYDCIGSDKRCVSGTCRTCNDYLYSDGCSGCAGQGGNACWHKDIEIAGGFGCGDVCAGYGGCIAANWKDTTSCTVCKNLFDSAARCSDGQSTVAPVWVNIIGDGNHCYYRREGYSQICSNGPGGWAWRLCVCLW